MATSLRADEGGTLYTTVLAETSDGRRPGRESVTVTEGILIGSGGVFDGCGQGWAEAGLRRTWEADLRPKATVQGH
jgi:hypothetical protein